MKIRKAQAKDIDSILKLLSQVLEIHAKIRPDIFISGTTKYTREELLEILNDNSRPVYVAESDSGIVGYAFCIVREAAFSTTMHPKKSLYIDDLCVDGSVRGKGIGKALFSYVKSEAKRLSCSEVTLAVWHGNDSAMAFYERQGMTPKKTIMEIKID